MNFNLFISVLLVVSILSCRRTPAKNNDILLARVSGEYLYVSDFLGENFDIKDTVLITPEAVNNWIYSKLWYQAAKRSIKNTKELKKQVQDYKENLIVLSYKDQLAKEANLPISEDELKMYYKDHKDDFVLKESVYRVQYVVLSKSNENLDAVRKNLENEEHSEYLNQYCHSDTVKCIEFPTWVNNRVLEDVGLPSYLWNESLKTKEYHSDSGKICIYRIVDQKSKGNTIPFDMVKAEIASIIKFGKEKAFIDSKEEELIINAQNKKRFEIY